jgi:hypothetical protein
MYWFAILIGAALGLVGGVTGLIVAYATHGLTPLVAPANFNAFATYVMTMLGPIASIVMAILALKKQYLGVMWVPELAGMLMYGSGVAMMGFVATGRLSLLPAVCSALGGLFILFASDELKRAPSA